MITEYTNTTPVEHAIMALLESSADLVSIYGKHMSPDQANSQTARRYLVYHIIVGTGQSVKQQISRVDSIRVQVDTFAPTRDQASSDGLRVRRALENKPGIYAGIDVSMVKWEQFNGDFEEGTARYKASNDFILNIQNQ